jgi:hypothetical protein
MTIIILCLYVLYFIKSESYKCMNNPLVYGVSKYRTSGVEVTCTCSGGINSPSILVTKDNISLLDSYNNYLLPNS